MNPTDTNNPDPMQPVGGVPAADPTAIGVGTPGVVTPAPVDQPAQVNPEPSVPVETPVVTGDAPVAPVVPTTEGTDAPGGSTPPPAPTV